MIRKAKFQVYEASLSIEIEVVAARTTGHLRTVLLSFVRCMSNRPAFQERTLFRVLPLNKGMVNSVRVYF